MAENGLCYHTGLLGLAAEESQDHPVLSHGPQEEFQAPKQGTEASLFWLVVCPLP